MNVKLSINSGGSQLSISVNASLLKSKQRKHLLYIFLHVPRDQSCQTGDILNSPQWLFLSKANSDKSSNFSRFIGDFGDQSGSAMVPPRFFFSANSRFSSRRLHRAKLVRGGATMKEITVFNSQVTDPQFQELFFPRTILLNKVVKTESYESLTKSWTHQTSLLIEEPSTLHNEAQLNPFLSTISENGRRIKQYFLK